MSNENETSLASEDELGTPTPSSEAADNEESTAPHPGTSADSEQAQTDNEELVEVVGVRFKASGKIYYFAPCGFTLKDGDHVIVDTARGQEYGTVSMPNREIRASEIVPPIRKVIRIATEEDTERRKRNEELEISAYNTFIERIDAHGLTMKLIDVECAFDNSKLLFYFSAENRIDFRELVKELAGIFHTRIELRQIGIRDETKMLGGLGICGRPFCCSTFLDDSVQVYIKMAKEQNLSLNAAKISGACGRLMCCLRYEYESYLAEKAITPAPGAEVMTPDGEGRVTDSNPLTGIVKVKLAGTAENDAPTVFVREDLVLKENYKGETLTRTPLPEKRTNVPSAGFEVRSPFSEAPNVGDASAEAAERRLQERKQRQGKPQKEHRQPQGTTQKQHVPPEAALKPQTAPAQRADGTQNGAQRSRGDGRPQREPERQGKHGRSEQSQQARPRHPDGSVAAPKKNNERFKGGRDQRNAAEQTAKREHSGEPTKGNAQNDRGAKRSHKPFHHKGGRPHDGDQ